jgi:hypothetical protein
MPRNSLPITMINLGFWGMRFPLTAAEFLAGQSARTWPPAILYEALEAGAKRMVGSLIRDDELVREGDLQSRRVLALTAAQRLQLEAERIRGAADEQLSQELESARHQREELAHETALRQDQIAHDASEQEGAVEEQTREKVVTDRERRAEYRRIAEESDALAERRRAMEAHKHVTDVEEDLQTKKAERKA